MSARYQFFDPLPTEQYEALKADIAKRGVLVPVEYDEDGNILDGHHRAQIAAELGIDHPRVIRGGLDEHAKTEHVLKLNLLRRHLGPITWAEGFRRLVELRGVQLGQGARNDRTSATVAEVAREAGINPRTARYRLQVAEDLAGRPDLAAKVDAGELSANVARQRAALAVRKERILADVPLPAGRFATIVADPPWQLAQAGATKADARRFYPTMPPAEITALPIESLAADDAHLWLWAINSLMEEAHQVARAWGFRPVTIVTWCKPRPGIGHYLRNNTEHVILATRGEPMTPPTPPMSTWHMWPSTAHSVKPEPFFDLVREVSPGPRLELFARKPHQGFTAWGNEAGDEDDERAS